VTQRQSNNHVSLLTTSTICNNTFDIILNQSYCSSYLSSTSTQKSQEPSSRSTLLPKSIGPGNLKNSSCYLCCCMNQCRHWSRAFYSICQPNMQSLLCTFSQSTTSNTKANDCRIFRSFSKSSLKTLISRP
jgi:hypothetical protein